MIWFWSGIILIAVGVTSYGLSRWHSSHESVQNGLVLSGSLSCLVNGLALVVIALW